jgi:hypothetical protein
MTAAAMCESSEHNLKSDEFHSEYNLSVTLCYFCNLCEWIYFTGAMFLTNR